MIQIEMPSLIRYHASWHTLIVIYFASTTAIKCYTKTTNRISHISSEDYNLCYITSTFKLENESCDSINYTFGGEMTVPTKEMPLCVVNGSRMVGNETKPDNSPVLYDGDSKTITCYCYSSEICTIENGTFKKTFETPMPENGTTIYRCLYDFLTEYKDEAERFAFVETISTTKYTPTTATKIIKIERTILPYKDEDEEKDDSESHKKYFAPGLKWYGITLTILTIILIFTAYYAFLRI